jgi:hypothetical protein
MYLLRAKGEVMDNARAAGMSPNSWDEIHWKYGHIAYSSLEILKKKVLVDGLMVNKATKPSQCEVCIQAKITHHPFPKD